MQELDEYINRIKHLPPAPRVLPELLPLLNRPNIDASRVVKLISIDPGLSAAVLQTCNSAYFGGGNPTADISEAVNRMGFQQIFLIVCAVTGSKTLAPPQKGYGIDRGELWQHSVTAAVAAQRIAIHVGDDENLVFTATLLHDLGKIILSEALENNYTRVIEETEKNQRSLVETEKKLLGVEHAEVGGRLLARWRFPSNVVSAVWFHHNPKAAAPSERLASHVYLGDMIAHFMGQGFGHQAFALKGRSEAMTILGLSPDMLPKFMIETHEKMEMVNALLSINA
jgi:putative nucleotidyltransferase with HDIG domain